MPHSGARSRHRHGGSGRGASRSRSGIGPGGRAWITLILLMFFGVVLAEWGLRDLTGAPDPVWGPPADDGRGYRPSLLEQYAGAARVAVQIVAGLLLFGLVAVVTLEQRSPRRRVFRFCQLAGVLACGWGFLGPAAGLSPPSELVGPAGIVILTTCFVLEAVRSYSRRRAPRRPRAVDLGRVDAMGPAEFRRHVVALLRIDGFEPAGADGEFLVFEHDERDYLCQVVHARDAIEREVPERVCLAASRAGYDEALLVTNAELTPEARRVAATHGCRVVERPQLGELFARFLNQRGGRTTRLVGMSVAG